MKKLFFKVSELNVDVEVKINLDSKSGHVVVEVANIGTFKLHENPQLFSKEFQSMQKGVCIQDKGIEIKSLALINRLNVPISYDLCTDDNEGLGGRLTISKFTEKSKTFLLAASDENSSMLYWSPSYISKELEDFYKDIAASKRQESWQELLNLDGQVVLDLSKYRDKETMIYINCMNNPYYFIDMLGLKLDIGSYMAIRTHMHGHCISLELPSGIVDYHPIMIAYALWKLLFTEELVLIPIEDATTIETMLNNLPDYIAIKNYETISENILFTKEDLVAERECNTNSIVNTFYIDKDYVEDMEFTDHTLIAADFLTAKTYYDPIIEKLGVKQNPFKQIKFNMFELGYDFNKAEELFAYEDESLETFLKKYVL